MCRLSRYFLAQAKQDNVNKIQPDLLQTANSENKMGIDFALNNPGRMTTIIVYHTCKSDCMYSNFTVLLLSKV